MRRLLAAVLAVGILTALPGLHAAGGEREDAAHRGATYIVDRQTETGAFFEPTQSADSTAESLLAVIAGGIDGEPVDRALGYLADHGPARAEEQPAYAGKIAMGLAAAGRDPRDFDGVDYVALAEAEYNAVTGSYDTSNLYSNALAALGPVAADGSLPDQAVRYFEANQCADGGFAWAEACLAQPDVDTTSIILNVLVATGVSPGDSTVSNAREWLGGALNDEGGFGHHAGEQTNANSTGLALTALAAMGEDPTQSPWVRNGKSAVHALLGLQHSSGGFRWRADRSGPDDHATIQAVPGIAGQTYPLRTPEPETTSTSTPAPAPAGATQEPTPPATPDQRQARTTKPSPGSEEQAAPTPVAPTPTPDNMGEHRAGLVVRFGSGEEERFCVPFAEPEITGEDLLMRTGLDLEVERAQLGTSVCRIGPDGCPPGDCFCEYPTFWGYWNLDPDDETWVFSELGAADRTVTDGTLDAWVWGEDGEPAPEETSVEEICANEGAVTTPTERETPESSSLAHEPTEDESTARGALVGAAGLGLILAGSGILITLRRRGLGG